MRRLILALGILAALGLGVFGFVRLRNEAPPPEPTPAEFIKPEPLGPEREIIGASVQGRNITAYHYLPRGPLRSETGGTGDIELLFIGGIHGGYEWNSVLLAYEFMNYLKERPEVIPENISVTVIPNANPDGVYKVIGKEDRFTIADVPAGDTSAGRFNANNVDLNRNFPCRWRAEAVWRGNAVSAGASPFSEPETQAFREFVTRINPDAVIMWHSQANAVYPGECGGDILEETRNIMHAYARASGYRALETFDDYVVTGSADGWLALLGIPALTVELQTHETIEWERNRAGIEALFDYYRR